MVESIVFAGKRRQYMMPQMMPRGPRGPMPAYGGRGNYPMPAYATAGQVSSSCSTPLVDEVLGFWKG